MNKYMREPKTKQNKTKRMDEGELMDSSCFLFCAEGSRALSSSPAQWHGFAQQRGKDKGVLEIERRKIQETSH